ncbi:MAG: tetratricopeptide repeat protein [Gammaproteobacteria bacterium]|nr:tetratricopeptide repeat protein [Gammaproteobacteria bacterium]MBV8404097.1 tetratricopeptide repeat protein [Gammaproteobacteria bacterium]
MGSPGTSTTLQRAQALHRQGQLQRAQLLYGQVLARDATNFHALHLSGMLAVQTGRPLEALQFLERALEVDPASAQAHFNRGSTLRELGRPESALSAYDRAIALKPDYAEAHNGRGAVLRLLGRLAAALESCEQAIRLRADYAEAHVNHGNVLRDLGLLDAALASYERASTIRPLALAFLNRGNVQRELGRPEAALASYDRAIALSPGCAEAYCNRAAILREQGQPEAALASCDRALAIRADFAEAHSNRGNALRDLGQLAAALASYDQALALQPGYADAHVNRGNLLHQQGQLGAALASYDRALVHRSDCAEAHANRGIVLQEQGDLDAALASYDRAIALKADYAEAYTARGMLRLLRGDYTGGWADYEWRWRTRSHRLSERPTVQPAWSGQEPLEGRTVLLHSEQGLGDALQFCRYVQVLAARGAIVKLEVPGSLAGLLSRLAGVDEVIVRGEPWPAADFHTPLMSLPLAFNTTLGTVPATVPYLTVDARKAREWHERLGPRTGLRVGLVWSGGFRQRQPELWEVNARRNVPLAALAQLRHRGVQFYSLQKGQPAEAELARARELGWAGPDLIDHTQLLRDFEDTAALVDNLDLVITVDTSVAHLAGALGKPVWLMNRFDTCWRWMLERTDSPWYPTLRIYRQRVPGAWDEVVQRIHTDLCRLAAQGTAAR